LPLLSSVASSEFRRLPPLSLVASSKFWRLPLLRWGAPNFGDCLLSLRWRAPNLGGCHPQKWEDPRKSEVRSPGGGLFGAFLEELAGLKNSQSNNSSNDKLGRLVTQLSLGIED
jgi:hypothetical protein